MSDTDSRPKPTEQGDLPPAADPRPAAADGEARAPEPAPSNGRAAFAAVLAWLVPGAGHLYLGRRVRAALFVVLIGASFVLGVGLEGKLWQLDAGEPASFLGLLGTFGCMGLGIPYFLLRFAGYQGDLLSSGYEYGGAFLLTAGLMNLLLVLDAWDVARGVKP